MPGLKTGYTGAETRRAESYRPPERSVPRASDLAGMHWPKHAFMVFSYDQLSTIFLLGARLHRTEQNPLCVVLQFTADPNGYTNLEVLRPEAPQPPGTSRIYLARSESGNELYDFNGPAGAQVAQDLRKSSGMKLSFTAEVQEKISRVLNPPPTHTKTQKRPRSKPWTFEDWQKVDLTQLNAWYEAAYPNPVNRPAIGSFVVRFQKIGDRYFGIYALQNSTQIKETNNISVLYFRKNGPESFELRKSEKSPAHDIAHTWHKKTPEGLKLQAKAQAARKKVHIISGKVFEKPTQAKLTEYWHEAFGAQANTQESQTCIVHFYAVGKNQKREYHNVKALTADSPEIPQDQNVGKIPLTRHPDGNFEIGKPWGLKAADVAQKWARLGETFLRASTAAQTTRSKTAALSKADIISTSREKLEARWREAYGKVADPNAAQDFIIQFRRNAKHAYEAFKVLLPNSPELRENSLHFGKLYFTRFPDGNFHLRKAKDLGAADFATAWRDNPVEGLTVAEDAVYAWRHQRTQPKGFATVEILSDVILSPITLPAKLSWQTVRTALTHPLFRESAGFVAADTAAKIITGHADEIDFKQSAKMMAIDSTIRTPSRAILADFLPKAGAARSFMLSNFPTVLTMAVMDYSATGSIHPLSYAESLPLMGMGNLFGQAVTAWLQESFAFAKFAGSFASFTTFFVLADFKQRYEQTEALAISTAQLANALKSSAPGQSKLQQYIQQRLLSSSAGSAMSALLEKIANATEKPDEELENIVVYDVQRLLKRPSCWAFPQLLKIAEQKNRVVELRQVYLEAATQRAAELQKEIDELVTNSTDEVEGKLYQPLIRMELENALDLFKLSSAKRYADTVDAQIATFAVGLAQNLRRQVFATQLQTYEAQLTQLQQDQLRVVHYDCEREQFHPLCQMQNSGKFLREDVAGVEALDWSQQNYTLQESPPEDLSLLKEMNVADALLFMKYRGVELFPTAPQK